MCRALTLQSFVMIQACTRCSVGLLLTNSGNWGRGIAGMLSPLCPSATAPLGYTEMVLASAPLLKAAVRAVAGLSRSSSSNSGCDLKLFSQLISCCKLMRVDPQLRDPEALCVLMSEAASSFVAQARPSPEAPAAVELLPWLVLQGRVFLYLSARLTTALSAVDMQLPAEGMGAAPISGLLGATLQCGDAAWGSITCVQHSTTSAQLTAEGYDVPQLLHQLQDTQAALEPLRQILEEHEEGSGVPQQPQLEAASSAALGPAVGQLQALGLLLCNLAMPHACNNPVCTNLAGPSELQLVGGRSAICGGCMKACYCSRVCQRQHWKQHKPVCKKLAAAAASTAGAAGSAAPAPAPVAVAVEASDV